MAYDLRQLYAVLQNKQGLQNINFNENDVQNAITPEMFQHSYDYNSDLDLLEQELYLNKMYNTSMDTPVNQIPRQTFNNIMADRNYDFYMDEPNVGLYANGYIGDLSEERLNDMRKNPEYWNSFYASMYR